MIKEKKQPDEGEGQLPNIEELKGLAKTLVDETAEIIRKYPLRSVGGAFVAGFLLSSLLRRDR